MVAFPDHLPRDVIVAGRSDVMLRGVQRYVRHPHTRRPVSSEITSPPGLLVGAV
jgi:hypothetical protein